MADSAIRRHMARLSFEDGTVVVTPRDRDIFLISAERATEACRELIQHDQRVVHFEDRFLAPLGQWCERHADQIRACYVPSPGKQIQVFVVTKGSRFDFALAVEIAALELELAKNGWRVGVSQIPDTDEETVGTFFNTDGALQIDAHSGSAAA